MPTPRGPSSRARRSSRSGEQVRGLVRAGLLCAAIAAFAPIAAADPDEADPDLAKRDEDYAAGKRAVEKKDWAEAVRLFKRAEMRHPDNADLQNILGFSYRNLKQYDLAFKHYKRAIELDPRHRGAHEYIGEAYLMTGDLAGRGEAPRGAQGDLPAALRGAEGPRARDCGVSRQDTVSADPKRRVTVGA